MTCQDGLRHYEVLSGEVEFSSGYLEPPDWGRCWGSYLAKNKEEAKKQAIKDPEFSEWVKEMRGEGKPPWAGLTVTLFRCEHGFCYGCMKVDTNCPACEVGFTDAEMLEGLKSIRDDLRRAA